jgi:CheY-like chemotaxis protein
MSCTRSAADSTENMSMTGSALKRNCEDADKSEVLTSYVQRKGKSALSKTVLLVDDNPVQLSTRQMVLSQAGLEVQVATSADSALALLRSLSDAQKMGVIVTDHIMPEATGSDFVRLVRQINPKVPVIVISGLAEAEQEYTGMDILFRQKPCPPPELIKLVQAAVAKSGRG